MLSPDTILMAGKIVFIVALYGFLFAVFRGLMAEAARSSRAPHPTKAVEGAGPAPLRPPVPVRTPAARGQVELRPPGTGVAPAPTDQVTLRPVDAPGLTAPSPAPQVTVPVVPAAPVVVEGVASAPRPLAPPAPVAPVAAPVVARLVVLTSPEASLTVGQGIDVEGTVSFGRGEENSIVLKDRFVSGRHAEVARRGNDYVLRDLGSTNGTFRNGMRIDGEAPLRGGDRIGIGTSVFAFHEGG